MENSKEGYPVHYRCMDTMHTDGIHIDIRKFYPIKETKHCYFVLDEYQILQYRAHNTIWGGTRRVYKDATRSFCVPTKEKALRQYRARKAKQFELCKRGMETAKLALEFIDGCDTVVDGNNMGKIDDVVGRWNIK